MTRTHRCALCKRAVTALKINGTDRFVVLPHHPQGGKPKWGENCGQVKR